MLKIGKPGPTLESQGSAAQAPSAVGVSHSPWGFLKWLCLTCPPWSGRWLLLFKGVYLYPGISLIVSSNMGEDILVSFGGYNGCFNNEVYVVKPSHKSVVQPQLMERPMSGSVTGPLPTDAHGDVKPEFETKQNGKIREIIMDNVNSEPVNTKSKEMGELLITTVTAEKEELETALSKEKLRAHQLKQELTEAESQNTDLTKELQYVRGQLAAEQSMCFKLEIDVAELRQKLQTLETLKKEVELLQRQKAASELAALNPEQRHCSGNFNNRISATF